MVKAITAVTAAIYMAIALWLFAQRDERIFRFLLVPAAGFVAVTILRKLIAAKRPYEIYGFTPLFTEGYQGKFLSQSSCVFKYDHSGSSFIC